MVCPLSMIIYCRGAFAAIISDRVLNEFDIVICSVEAIYMPSDPLLEMSPRARLTELNRNYAVNVLGGPHGCHSRRASNDA